jgi:hypothetical protein
MDAWIAWKTLFQPLCHGLRLATVSSSLSGANHRFADRPADGFRKGTRENHLIDHLEIIGSGICPVGVYPKHTSFSGLNRVGLGSISALLDRPSAYSRPQPDWLEADLSSTPSKINGAVPPGERTALFTT